MYYTKYRPQTFKEVQRPNEIADALLQQLKTGKTVHAYLFTGPRGVGKTTVARLLAKGLCCTTPTKDGDVCGVCPFCLAVQNGNLLDLIEIDAASNRGIDDIRELKEKVKLLPAEGKKKIYIIDEVHMLTNEAFNALLKTLEEPPKHAVFILCTTEMHKVPETIKSRCQIFRFKRPTRPQIVEKLRRIADSELPGEKLGQAELERVAIMAGGAFRDAETILQQLIEAGVGNGKFYVVDSTAPFIYSVAEGDVVSALQTINTIFDDGADLAVWVDGLIRYLRDLLYLKMGFSDDYFSLDPDALADRKTLVAGLTSSWLVQAVEVFTQAQNALKNYSIPQLALELAVIKLTSWEPDPAKTPKPPVAADSGGSEPANLSSKLTNQELSQKSEVRPDTVPVSAVQEKWREVMTQVSKLNSSVGALLKSAKPIGVEGSAILLEVSYKFHKERLESSANLKIVESVLTAVFNCRSTVKCIVCPRELAKKGGETGDLTDMNVRLPQTIVIDSKTSVVEVFDGGLPL